MIHHLPTLVLLNVDRLNDSKMPFYVIFVPLKITSLPMLNLRFGDILQILIDETIRIVTKCRLCKLPSSKRTYKRCKKARFKS